MLKGVHLTLLIGPTLPVPAPLDVTEALVSAQVTVPTGERTGFQVVFHFGMRSLISTALLPAGYFDPGIRVILMATINGIPQVLSDGLITRQDVVPSSVPGQSSLTITGEDVSVAMDLVDNSKKMVYPALPPSARVLLLIAKYAKYGMIPLVIPSPSDEVKPPTSEVPAHEGTDLAYIKKLAADTGYVFRLEPGPAPGVNLAYWGPEIRISPPQRALNINMDAATNVESLSFSYNGLGREQLVLTIQEPLTKLPIPIPLPEFSPLAPPLALRQATALKQKDLERTANQSVIKSLARAMGKVAESANAIAGNGTLDVLRYGAPLRAGLLVGVRGAGIAYDGLYFVKSVTHQIKPGEFRQSFTVVRNGLVPLTPMVPA